MSTPQKSLELEAIEVRLLVEGISVHSTSLAEIAAFLTGLNQPQSG